MDKLQFMHLRSSNQMRGQQEVKPQTLWVMAPPWLVMWALAITLTWLLPNHYLPWSTFHSDAWFSFMALCGALVLLWRARTSVVWYGMPCFVAVLLFLPWIQFGLGLIPFAGQPWMSSSYLLGFLLALLVGGRWESVGARQLPDALFLAIGVAAIVSVWLQLYTWLGLWQGELMDVWSMGISGTRPYANLGQPNQLATLLLWALLAGLWFYLQGRIRSRATIFISVFLLVGLALTQSRMATLALTAIFAGVWFWRGLWPSPRMPWLASALYTFYWICPFLLRWLNSALLLGQDGSYLRLQQQGELRLGAWHLFSQAVVERPWLGYGWADVRAAQVAVADHAPGLGATFAQSHNLFLDFLLWNGVPLGLLISAFVLRWFWTRFRAIKNSADAVLFMLLGAVSIHAMVELPLHYAYFLLPVGLVIGVLDVRLSAKVIWKTPQWTLTVLWALAVVVFAVIVRDYFLMEASYQTLRFEKAAIGRGKASVGGPPEVLVLTQLREWVRLARFKAHSGMTEEELKWMSDVTVTYPSGAAAYRLANAFALNDRPREALLWLRKICKIDDENSCRLAQRAWEDESRLDPRIAAIQWPSK